MAGEATGHTLRLATLQQDRRQIPSGHISLPTHPSTPRWNRRLPSRKPPIRLPCRAACPKQRPGAHIPHNLKSRNPLLLPAGISGETRPKRPLQCNVPLPSSPPVYAWRGQRAKTPVAAGVRKGLSRPIPSRNPHIHRPLPSSNSAVGAWLCVEVEGGVRRKFALFITPGRRTVP